jgi:hypothetical protein
MSKTKEIVVGKGSFELSNPNQMVQAAKIIKEYIIKNKLSDRIVNSDYVRVEGWQFAGSLMALYPRVVEVKELSANKWLAHAEIVNRKTGEVVGSGFALCSKSESKKASFDEYAILSMAQTRAIGKAFRNVIGWIIKLAGYEPVPAEEIKGKKEQPIENNLKGQAGDILASDTEKKRIVDLCKKEGAENPKQVASLIKARTGKVYNWIKMTKNEASHITYKLLEKQTNGKK